MGFMNKLTEVLDEKLTPIAAKVATQRHMQAIRDGLILTMPLLIIGSFFLILAFLPIPAVDKWMSEGVGAQLRTYLLYPVDATFGLMALVACFGIGYRLSEKYKLDALAGATLSVIGFMIVTPFKIALPDGKFMGGGIPMVYMGSQGLFVAMIMAILCVEIFRIVIQKNLVIKLPDSVPPSISKSFSALIPGTFIIVTALALRILFEVTPFENMHKIVSTLLSEPLTKIGTTYIGMLVIVLLMQLLWVCGLHGPAIVGAVTTPIFTMAMDQNRAAFQAGQAVPNIVTSQFQDLITSGGSGMTLAFALMLAFWAKSKQLKEIGKLSLAPGLFNINEPIVFGVPVVMNPVIMIPFILTPMIVMTFNYICMKMGIVAKPAGLAVPWTTPMILQGFLITGGKISGGLLQIIDFLMAAVIYYPFFKEWDKQKVAEEAQNS